MGRRREEKRREAERSGVKRREEERRGEKRSGMGRGLGRLLNGRDKGRKRDVQTHP